MRRARSHQLAWGLVFLAYALLVHYSNLGRAPPALGAALAMAPLLLVFATLLWRRRWHALLVALMLASCALLLWLAWGLIERHFEVIYLCQQCALYAALTLAFGRTLLPGEVPLCTRWAVLVHGTLPRETRRYTRAVTLLWTVFFAIIVAITLLLYLYASHSVWSLFVNFLILPAMLLLFAAEYLWRRRALPNVQHASLRDMARLAARGSSLLGVDASDVSRAP